MEPESPGSPIDECEYTRLIETTVSTPQEQQAPESGFVCASPCSTQENESRGSASSSDVQFFDPESSDTGTEFYDCPAMDTAQPHRPHRRVYHHLSHNKIAIRPPSPIVQSPSSSSSSATPTSKMNGHVRLLESGDSSESLPPSQSTSSNLNCEEGDSMSTANSNSNSTLQDADAEMPLNEVSDMPAAESVRFDESADNDKCTLRHFDSSKTIFVKYNEDQDDEESKSHENESDIVSPPQEEEEEEEEEIEEEGVGEEDVEEEVELEEEEANEAEFDQDKILEQITTKNEEFEKESSPESNADEQQQKMRKDSDTESEYDRPPRVRRCSSLKTGKTPPGTPGRKKIVRFADVLGLDLADVRTFLDEVPKIPKSAYEDLDVTLPSQTMQLGPPLEKVLVPLFQQPGCLPNFLERLRDSQVCLENAAVTDPVNLTISGCVRVRNLDFHKSVHIRYTLDNWRTYSDLTGSYVENSCDGFSDKFSFIFFGNSLQIGGRVEMAIRFQVKGEQYWDSNYGMNYCFQCLPCNTIRSSPIMASDDSSLSSSSEGASPSSLFTDSASTAAGASSSSESVMTHVDPLGHRQWSNSFLY
jgi:protein phosphatase 1 regulatory subunit 3A/B/C/D/E